MMEMYNLEKSYSTTELRDIVLENLEEILNKIPAFPQETVDLESIESVNAGAYRINERPTLDLLQNLPLCKRFGREAEIGILCVRNQWLISVNDDLSTRWPDALRVIESDSQFQFDAHTHPGSDIAARQPSDSDIEKLESTIDHKNYILTAEGLIEFAWTENLPGGFSELQDAYGAWSYWINSDLRLTKEQFEQIGSWKLKERFYQKL